jgi:hypothetical protein
MYRAMTRSDIFFFVESITAHAKGFSNENSYFRTFNGPYSLGFCGYWLTRSKSG